MSATILPQQQLETALNHPDAQSAIRQLDKFCLAALSISQDTRSATGNAAAASQQGSGASLASTSAASTSHQQASLQSLLFNNLNPILQSIMSASSAALFTAQSQLAADLLLNPHSGSLFQLLFTPAANRASSQVRQRDLQLQDTHIVNIPLSDLPTHVQQELMAPHLAAAASTACTSPQRAQQQQATPAFQSETQPQAPALKSPMLSLLGPYVHPETATVDLTLQQYFFVAMLSYALSAGLIQQPVNFNAASSRQSAQQQWIDATRQRNSVYLSLINEYLIYFLPVDALQSHSARADHCLAFQATLCDFWLLPQSKMHQQLQQIDKTQALAMQHYSARHALATTTPVATVAFLAPSTLQLNCLSRCALHLMSDSSLSAQQCEPQHSVFVASGIDVLYFQFLESCFLNWHRSTNQMDTKFSLVLHLWMILLQPWNAQQQSAASLQSTQSLPLASPTLSSHSHDDATHRSALGSATAKASSIRQSISSFVHSHASQSPSKTASQQSGNATNAAAAQQQQSYDESSIDSFAPYFMFEFPLYTCLYLQFLRLVTQSSLQYLRSADTQNRVNYLHQSSQLASILCNSHVSQQIVAIEQQLVRCITQDSTQSLSRRAMTQRFAQRHATQSFGQLRPQRSQGGNLHGQQSLAIQHRLALLVTGHALDSVSITSRLDRDSSLIQASSALQTVQDYTPIYPESFSELLSSSQGSDRKSSATMGQLESSALTRDWLIKIAPVSLTTQVGDNVSAETPMWSELATTLESQFQFAPIKLAPPPASNQDSKPSLAVKPRSLSPERREKDSMHRLTAAGRQQLMQGRAICSRRDHIPLIGSSLDLPVHSYEVALLVPLTQRLHKYIRRRTGISLNTRLLASRAVMFWIALITFWLFCAKKLFFG